MRNIKQADFCALLYDDIVSIATIVCRSTRNNGALNTAKIRAILKDTNEQFTYCDSFGADNDCYYCEIVDKFEQFITAVENNPARMSAENQRKWALYYVDALSNWCSFVRNGRKIEYLRQLEG